MKRFFSSGQHGGIFETGSGFYYYTGKIFDVMLLSALWLLGSLPVLTVGASFCALYAAASRSLRRDIGTTAREYWKSWRRELKASVPLWLVFCGAVFILLLNLGIIWKLADGLFRLFLVLLYGLCLLLVLCALCYAFPALSRFDMPVGWIVRLSFYMTFRHLPVSLMLVVMAAAGYFLVLVQFWSVLFVPGAIAWAVSALVDPLLAQHMPPETEEDRQHSL